LGNLIVDSTMTKVTGPVSWEWNGYTRKGRKAATGTYLFKAVYYAARLEDDGGEAVVGRREVEKVERLIGFTR